MNKYYKCIKCYKTYPFQKEILTCENHNQYYGYLTLIYDYQNIHFSNIKKGWEKYGDLLPIDQFNIHFSEQKTPFVKLQNLGKKYGFANLFLKDESKNPTGSFKDKESICAINLAIEWKIDEIFVATAAYAQKAGIKCTCLVPKNLSSGKRLLIDLYGGKIVEEKGNYETIYRDSLDKPKYGWNCTPGINPIKEEGIKLIGFEIWEDMGVPDIIVVPCGNGTLLFGIYKAFKELMHLGLIHRLPKMIGIQIKNASPLKIAFEKNKDYAVLSSIPNSIAEGIVAMESYSSPKVMHALKDTQGEIIEVDDLEVANALNEIIKEESLIPEPTAAVVYASLAKIKASYSDNIVLIQSAGGMKNLNEIIETIINTDDK
jgi:threonine synthase